MTGQRFCRPHRLAVPSVGQTATRPRFADRTPIYLAEGSEASGFWAFRGGVLFRRVRAPEGTSRHRKPYR